MKMNKLSLPFKMSSKSDRTIYACVIVVAIFGLFMIASASMGIAAGNNSYLFITIVKQIIFLLFGYLGMTFLAKYFSLINLNKYISFIIFGTIFALLITVLWDPVGGARAWIRIPLYFTQLTIQPSEFAKISSILIIAYYFGDMKEMKLKPIDYCKKPFGYLFAIIFIVAIIESDFGSASVLMCIICICFLVPSNRLLLKYQNILIILILITFCIIIFILSPIGNDLLLKIGGDYKIGRFLIAANPFNDKYSQGYQIVTGLISFASGGIFGVGFGNSIRKYTNFPAANTDFILAIIVEELGICGFIIILICYSLIIYKLFYWACKMKSQKGKIILVGTAMYIFIHFIFNVGGVSALIPLTGVPLLMISAGGSSTMSLMCCIGISQAVIKMFRQGVIE